jgi:hypothetical protein
MRTVPPKQPLIVTEEERERLESLAHRARSQSLLARRARVVLACAEGLDRRNVCRPGSLCGASGHCLSAGGPGGGRLEEKNHTPPPAGRCGAAHFGHAGGGHQYRPMFGGFAVLTPGMYTPAPMAREPG